MTKEGRVKFAELSGFGSVIDNEVNKINTKLFLNAAKEIIKVIESFGKLFSPVVMDMQGNANKIETHYQTDTEKHLFIEDLILLDIQNPESNTTCSLLWLKRALEFIEHFFTNILTDEDQTKEDLRKPLKNAYSTSLKQFHGFFLQQTFSWMQSWAPNRTTLFGCGDDYQENINSLRELHPQMTKVISKLNEFYQKHNLDDQKIV